MSRLMISAALLLALPSSSFAQQTRTFATSTDAAPVTEEIFETKDAAALTVGLTPLSKSQLPNGDREVRIWYSSFGNPQYLVIIRQTAGAITGRLLLRWDQYYEISPVLADTRVDAFVGSNYDCGPVSKRDSKFGDDRWISSVCEARLKGTPDWNALLSEVESHALPQATSGAPVQDQSEQKTWGITVERKSGPAYGVSHYQTAMTFGAPEPGRGLKLQDMVNALAGTAKRESAVAQH
jgi:hypothetical protein